MNKHAIVLLSMLPGLALAQADANNNDVLQQSAPQLTANVTFTSQYVSRGFRQTWGKPALQGGVDYTTSYGLAVGAWASNVSNRLVENGSTEWDLYATYNGRINEDFGYLLNLTYYAYPGASVVATNTTYNWGEIIGGITYKFLYVKYQHVITHAFFGIEDARHTGYLDIGANYPLADGLTLNLHYGRQSVKSQGNADNSVWNWHDYKVGLTKDLGKGWNLAGAYTVAKPKTGVYDHYTVGARNSAGEVETSNPAAGTFALSVSRVF